MWQLSACICAFETPPEGNWGFIFFLTEKNLFPYKRVSEHFLSKIKNIRNPDML